jgi:predicted nuclease of predicted toxin-antitoxin system
MPITIVLDQGVHGIRLGLRELGNECVHVSEVGMATAADEEILAFAVGKNGIVVTGLRALCE